MEKINTELNDTNIYKLAINHNIDRQFNKYKQISQIIENTSSEYKKLRLFEELEQVYYSISVLRELINEMETGNLKEDIKR